MVCECRKTTGGPLLFSQFLQQRSVGLSLCCEEMFLLQIPPKTSRDCNLIKTFKISPQKPTQRLILSHFG